ncbi:chemotaxis protein CheW, partial [uncultured Aquincola sp.]|uniref:chemotaxis protein CheW n=1 Tax=uncultured Aquincola sp. TaxID=886556 RepID=UPI0032B13290
MSVTTPDESQAVAAVEAAGAPREVLSFKLGAEEYGIDILKVQEIRGYEPPTRIAHAPHFFKGVVNLRGVIVPIIDLRALFGLENAEINEFTVVIILNIANRTVGIVVD